jgi:replicative DNA helicase
MEGTGSQNSPLPQKLPPQNIEAEQCLLGSLMIDKNAIIKVVDFLEPRDFYRKTHQEIYRAMQELFEKGEVIDFLSLSNRLKEKEKLEEVGGQGYLTELVNSVPNALHVLDYAKIVQKKRILRDLIDASYDIAQLGYEEKEDIEIVLDRAEKRIFGIAQKSLTQRFVPLKEDLEDAFQRIDRLSKHKGLPRGVPTGFVDLDKILSGLQNSDLIILASRPSIGKSSLALDIARHVGVFQKLPVGIFSLEMSKDQVIDRFIAAQAGVDLWRLRTGRLSDQGQENDFTKIQHALGLLSEAPIFIDDAATSNVLQMRAMARRLQAEYGLSLIIIDYLQLIEPRNPQVSMVQQMTEVSRALKGLAKELNVPVLALSQLSRAVEQRTPPLPRLSDLRESGCLSGDTLIIRADTGQRIPIKVLAERKIQTPIKVWTINENLKLESRFLIKAFSSGKKLVYKLKTKTGRIIKASGNHPFFSFQGWRRLDQLKIGDYIALPRQIKTEAPKNPISQKELILLAHLLGDGCILPRQPFHYTNANKKNIKIVQKTAKELFGIEGRLVKQKNWYHLYLKSPYLLGRGKRHPISIWFEKLGIGLKRSWEKEIPEGVFQCSSDCIALFLRHLWATDGSITLRESKNKKSVTIYFATSSPKMAYQVQALLLRLGIQSSVKEKQDTRKTSYKKMYSVYITGAKNQLRFLYRLGSFNKDQKFIKDIISFLSSINPNPNIDIIPKMAWRIVIEPVKNEIGMGWRELSKGIQTSYCGSTLLKAGISRKRMLKLYNVLKVPIIYNLATSDVFWDQIVSIEPIGLQEVYDATIEGNHNFVANDIIVHNSIEQDADVVLFIYREDKYKPDTSRKNIADILIAKHRNGPVGRVELFFNEPTASFSNLEKVEREEEEIIA